MVHPRPLIIAHRGFSGRFPENTLAAVRAAIAARADAVEIDVRQTRDARLAVFHDATLRRLCAAPDRLRDMSLAQLHALKPDTPTLAQVLRTCRDKAHVFIEIKHADAHRVARVIRKARMARQVTVFAFSLSILQTVAAADPTLALCGLVGRDLFPSIAAVRRAVPIQSVAVDRRLLRSPADVRRIHRLGLQLFVWTVNRPADLAELAAWGVDGLITNLPDLARSTVAPS